MAQKTFILGLGAQKAGTSWLHSYLEACDDTDFGLMKEYHVWDVWQDPQMFRKFHVTERALFKHRDTPRFPRLRLQYPMQTTDGFYGFYFQNLLARSGKSITGDITPSYAALTADTLAHVKDELEALGFDLKVVFLMRDPVERIWSSVRMERRIMLNNGSATLADLPAEDAHVAQLYDSVDMEIRTRYDRTLANIDTVFDPESVYFGFFETLFTKDGLTDISEFLGVPVKTDHLNVQVNVTERTANLSPQLRADIRDHYAAVYAACHDRFPQTRTLWG